MNMDNITINFNGPFEIVETGVNDISNYNIIDISIPNEFINQKQNLKNYKQIKNPPKRKPVKLK